MADQASLASSKKRGRPQGRPPRHSSVDLRQQIMNAAVELFAQRGYAATSVREIADLAGANAAMIHYYFGSKQALLHDALEHAVEPLAAAIANMKRSGKAPVKDIVRHLLSAFSQQPFLPVLMTREVLMPGGVMKRQFMEDFAPRLGGALPKLLEEEQKHGRLRGDLDPAIVAQSLLALCAFPFISRGMAEPVMGVSYDEAGVREIEKHVIGLLERGFIS